MLLQHPQPQSTREQTLSSYANHLQQLSVHLDDRARALQSSEARLAASQSELSTHRQALNQLETRTRHHIAQLLRHIHQRQAALVGWERTAASARKSVSKTLAVADTLLSDARDATSNLNQIRSQHHRLKSSVIQRRTQLAELQAHIETATRSHTSLKESIQNIMKDKQTIQRSADRLQSLDAALRSREIQLTAREQTLAKQKAHLQRLQPLEALSVPLQAFLDNAAAASLTDRVSVETDMVSGIDSAIVAMRQLQRATRDMQAARDDVNNLRQQLTSREARLKSRETDLNKQSKALDREKTALQLKISEVSRSQSEISAAWLAIEEARKETDAREEALRTRETVAEHAESRIQHRERALSEREKTLARRERSIRRAHAAVTARERAVEARERDIETERTRLTDFGKAIDVREDMLETRDLELSAREADCGGRLEALLQRSVEHTSSVQGARRNNSPPARLSTTKTSDDDADGREISEKLSGGDSANEGPPTVRRQLAFFESPKDDAGQNTDDGRGAMRKPDESNVPDDESEAAAEQLLPELVGARSYWRERVERLERIVQSMRNKTWAIKPHVLPVLTSVAEGLLAIRREIDEFPRPNCNNSPKNAYLNEQECQIQWREQLKQHFDSVREIQAGLLIRLNREEEAEAVQAEPQGEQSADTSNTAQSTVEATLDVTLTGDLTRDMLGTAVEGGDVWSSRPLSHLQMSREGILADPMLDVSAPLWSGTIKSIQVADEPRSSGIVEEDNDMQQQADVPEIQNKEQERQVEESQVNVDHSAEAPDAVGSNVLEELAMLRDDLANVTTSQDSETS